MFESASADCIMVMQKVDVKIAAIKGLIGGFEQDALGWQADELERSTSFANVGRVGNDTVNVSVGEHYRRARQRQLNMFQRLTRGRPRGATSRFGGPAMPHPSARRLGSQAKPILRPEKRELLMERLRQRAGDALVWDYEQAELGV